MSGRRREGQGRGEEGRGVMEGCLDQSLEVMGSVTWKIDDPCRIKWKLMLFLRCYN